jgi:hypothetical protein
MTITYQQQLALRRGLFLDTTTNQLITFDPVVANTQKLADINRTELVEISIPIDSEGSNETVNSVFSISPPGESVNITEAGKAVIDIAQWQNVSGAVGSKYIFIRNIASAEEAPQVGDIVTSAPNVIDNMYANNTVIEEINPTLTFTIKDISVISTTSEFVEVFVYALPDQGDVKFPLNVSGSSEDPTAQKFTFTLGSNIESALSFLDSAGPAFNSKLKQIFAYQDITGSDHPQCTIRNFINDLFTSSFTIDTYATGLVPTPVASNGRVGITVSQPVLPSSVPQDVIGTVVFRFYLDKLNMSIFANGEDLPETDVIGISNIFWLDGSLDAWNTGFPPGQILFKDVFSFGTGPSTVVHTPNTGDGSEANESLNPSSSLTSHLLCYKLNNPLVNYSGSFTSTSRTDVSRVSFAFAETGQTAFVGDSINKNSLLESWENGYHRAGMILQNKLKK